MNRSDIEDIERRIGAVAVDGLMTLDCRYQPSLAEFVRS